MLESVHGPKLPLHREHFQHSLLPKSSMDAPKRAPTLFTILLGSGIAGAGLMLLASASPRARHGIAARTGSCRNKVLDRPTCRSRPCSFLAGHFGVKLQHVSSGRRRTARAQQNGYVSWSKFFFLLTFAAAIPCHHLGRRRRQRSRFWPQLLATAVIVGLPILSRHAWEPAFLAAGLTASDRC